MSANPNSPMDQRLKDYARQRREDPAGPGPLHPATRRMLQQQVRESYPPGSASATRRNPPSVWPAWLREPLWVGLMTVATLTMIAVMIISRPSSTPQESQYAQVSVSQASAPTSAQATPSLETMAFDAKKSVALDAVNSEVRRSRGADRATAASDALSPRSALVREESTTLSRAASPASATPLASMPQTAPPSLAKPVEKELAPRAAAPASVASLASSAAPPSADVKALSDLADTKGWNMSFEQASASKPGAVAPDLTGRSNLGLKRPEKQKQSPLLQNFNMNYRDGTVLFQESDGSTYQGSLAPVTVEEFVAQQPRQSAAQVRSFAGAQGNAMNSQAVVAGLYRFQAQGSNRSLRQWVVLQGQLSNTLTSAAQKDQGGINLPSSKEPGQGWEIQSSVRVGSQTPMNLNARQVPPTPGSQSPSQKQ